MPDAKGRIFSAHFSLPYLQRLRNLGYGLILGYEWALSASDFLSPEGRPVLNVRYTDTSPETIYAVMRRYGPRRRHSAEGMVQDLRHQVHFLFYYHNLFLANGFEPPLHPITDRPITAEDLVSLYQRALTRLRAYTHEHTPIPDDLIAEVDGVLASFFACFETGATCGGHPRRPADFPADSLARAVRALLG